MKRLFIMVVLVALFFNTSAVFCDEVDESLKNMATQRVRNSTRMMINNGVPDDEAIKMTKLMLEKQYKEEYILRAHKIVMGAKKDGLPLGPIMNKAYEGIAKQAQERNVVQAMERVQNRYRFAADQAEKVTYSNEQKDRIRDMIADCSAAGVREDDIGQVTYEFQQRAREMNKIQSDELAKESFKTLRFMARIGIPSKDASDVVCEALKNRYTAKNMNTLRNRFMAQYKDSNPVNLARYYNAQLKKGKEAGQLAAGGGSTSNNGSSTGHGNSNNTGHSSGSGNSGSSHGNGGR